MYIIILDNPDNHIHERVIEEYAAKDARIQFLINKDEHGRTIALNRAINLAKGEYIAIMDADDIALPNRFSDELEYIEKYNSLASGFNLVPGGGFLPNTQKIKDEDIITALCYLEKFGDGYGKTIEEFFNWSKGTFSNLKTKNSYLSAKEKFTFFGHNCL